MTFNITKRFVFVVTLVAATAAANTQAAGVSKSDPYTDGARSVLDTRDPYSDGARGADPFTDGANAVAGLDRTGVSATPEHSVDPYSDGAHA